MKESASFKTLWIDPRKFSQCSIAIVLTIAFAAWVLVSVAIAQSLPEKQGETVRVEDVVRVQWWAITGLLSLLGIVVSVFIMRELNNAKGNIRELWKEKLSKEDHETIDHSQLCAVCRGNNKR